METARSCVDRQVSARYLALGALVVGGFALGLAGAGGARRPAVARGVPAADGFDVPVGNRDGDGYYDAQPFGTNDPTAFIRAHRPPR